LHVSLEAGAEFGDTGIDAVLEFFELIIVDAIQYLLFDEPPQAFDQIQIGRIGRQVKEFDAWFFGLAGNRLAFLVSGVVQHQSDGAAGARIGVCNFAEERADLPFNKPARPP
jgi:hypothetical protein